MQVSHGLQGPLAMKGMCCGEGWRDKKVHMLVGFKAIFMSMETDMKGYI